MSILLLPLRPIIRWRGRPSAVVQKVEIKLVDDLDGSPADVVITFGLDGKSYVIDLNTANADEFRSALAPYVKAARKDDSVKPASRAARAKAADAGPNTAEVREWAKKQGIEVPDRGRLSGSLVLQFQAATA